MKAILEVLKSDCFLTVISGVIVFVISQLFIEYFLNPIKEYKKLKADIAYTLTYYACYYMNPITLDNNNKMDKSKWDEAMEELRKRASECVSFSQRRPLFNPFVLGKEKLHIVEKELIGLSNGCVYNGDIDCILKCNEESRDKIFNEMKLH